MPTHKLRILGMTWENIRNFEHLPNPRLGTNKFDFNQEGWTLMQIQNNYGKTSTMHLLRSCLTGVKIGDKHLKGYRYRQGRTDWGGDPDGKSEFSVMLALDDEIFKIRTVLDWRKKNQEFHTYREGSGGDRPGWNPPEYFESLFAGKSDFAELLILDGEKARKMNRTTGENTIGRAVRQVTGLSSICDLIDEHGSEGRITQIVKDLEKTAGVGGKKTGSLEDKLGDCVDHRKYLETEREKIRGALEKAEKELDDVSEELDKFDEKHKGNSDEFEQAMIDKDKAKSALDREVRSVLKKLFNPGNTLGDNLWEDVVGFYGSQIRGKLPGEATGDWFKEIVEDRDNCICGIPWNDEMKSTVLLHAADYVDGRIHPRVKRMQKVVVDSSSTTDIGNLKAGLDARRKSFRMASKRARELRKDFPKEERERYKWLSKRQVELELSKKDLEHDFNIYDSDNRDFIMDEDLDRYTSTTNEEHNYIIIAPHIFEQINNLSELKKVEDNLRYLKMKTGSSAKKADGAKILREVLEESIARILGEIQRELEIKMNDFASKMPGVDFNISISESKLIFTNASGDVQEDANESAELGAVYGLVSALNEYADVSLPIVVDTPLAGFGRGMTKSWKEVIGEGFDQGIGLLNSGEKDLLRFWWQQEDLALYTFLRANEVVRTGRNPNDREPTGTMFIDNTEETFDQYEIDVGYETGVGE